MKTLKILLIVSISTLLTNHGFAQVTGSLVFDLSDIKLDTIGIYTQPSFPGCHYNDIVGAPNLPVIYKNYVLPKNAEITAVTISDSSKNILPETYLIFPTQPSSILDGRPAPSFVEPSPEYYSSNSRYSGEIIEFQSLTNFNGYLKLTLKFSPLQYIASSQQLILFDSIGFEVNYQITGSDPLIKKTTQYQYNHILKTLYNTVENKEDIINLGPMSDEIISYSGTRPLNLFFLPWAGGDRIDYLIITNEELKASFVELADWKMSKGIPSLVVSTNEISIYYPGFDLAEKIYNYLKDVFKHWGGTYVLLGGDTDIIPARFTTQEGMGGIRVSDLYYCDVKKENSEDYCWDENHNGSFFDDDELLDLGPDHIIGRAPVHSSQEVSWFIDKILSYEHREFPEDQIKNITLMGAYIAKCDNDTAQIIPMRDWWNASAIAIPNNFSTIKLYDRPNEWDGDFELTRETALDALINDSSPYDEPQHIIAHQDHSGVFSIGTSHFCHGENIYMHDIDDIEYRPETIYKILYSAGCEPNEYDKDCFSEHFLNGSGIDEMHRGIGVGFIGNSGLGQGADAAMGIAFFHHLYEQPLVNLGEIFNATRTAVANPTSRKNLNFLGDPQLPVWTNTLDDLIISTNPETLVIGENYLEVKVNGLENGENALVCIYKENEIYGTEFINEENKAVFENCKADTYGMINITATAPNHLIATSTISVENNQFPNVHLYFDESDPEPVELHRGTNLFKITLRNSGNITTATHVKANISLAAPCEGIIIYPSLPKNYPDIAPGYSEISLEDFSITVLGSAPDQSFVPLKLNIESDQGNFIEEFFLQIKSSQLQYRGNKISWTSENDDIFINPGETVKFKVELLNVGCRYANINGASIQISDPNLNEVINGNVSFGIIAPFDTSWSIGEFEVSTKENTLPPASYSLMLEITESAENNESIVHQFTIKINNKNRPDIFEFEPGLNQINLRWGFSDSYIVPLNFNIYKMDPELLPPGSDVEDSTLYERLNLYINHLPTYTDIDVEPGKIYYYKIACYNDGLPQGPFSPAFIAWTSLPSLEPWPVFLPEYGHRSEGSPILFNAIPIRDNLDDPDLEIFFPIDDGEDFTASKSALYAFYSDGQELYDIDDNPDTYAGFANYTNAGIKATPIVGELNSIVDYGEIAFATTLGEGSTVKTLLLYSAGDQNPSPDGLPDLLHQNMLNQPVKKTLVGSNLLPNDEIKVVTPELWHGILDVRNTSDGLSYGNDWWPIILPHISEGELDEVVTMGVPVIADLDLNDDKEIIIGCRGELGSHGLYVFNHDGSYFSEAGEPFYIPQNTANFYGLDCAPVIAELDCIDMNPEIIIMAIYCEDCSLDYPNLKARVIALNHDGTIVNHWEEDQHEIQIRGNFSNLYPAICAADIDNDGFVEIIVADDGNVWVWKSNGELFNQYFPIQVEGLVGTSLSPLVANVDQDPENEIIISSNSSIDQIFAFNTDGTQVQCFPIRIDGLMSTPAIGDVNHDGLNEIVAVYGGYVNVWKTKGETGHDEWPLYRLNSLNNAVYVEPACEYDPNNPLVYEEENNEINWAGYNVLTSDLIIPSGEILTIEGRVAMPEGAKIIVQRGGRLNLYGGVVTSACGGLWEGIEVWGYSNKSQLDEQYPPGIVDLGENAMIENAKCGIATIKKDNGVNDHLYTGGIVWSKDATFLNNIYGVRFYSYRNFYPNSPSCEINNRSSMKNCIFETNGRLADPDQDPEAFIRMDDVVGIKLSGNHYFNSTGISFPWDKRGIGIESYNAAYSVDHLCMSTPCGDDGKHSYFNNLHYGIRAFGQGRENGTVSVNHSDFYLNKNGMFISYINNVQVQFNKYTVPEISYVNEIPRYGLYLEYSTDYSIEENTFIGFDNGQDGNIGMYISNSGDRPNEVYKNDFSGLAYGIVALGVNRSEYGDGLCLKCNNFNLCQNDIHVIPEVEGENEWKQGRDQGIASSQGTTGSDTAPAGNTFTDKDMYETFNYFNHEYCNLIDYHHHRPPYPNGVIIKPDPRSENMVHLTQEIADYVNENHACPSNFGGVSINLSMEKSLIQFENEEVVVYTDSIQELVDGGDTYSLNFEVFTSTTDEAYEIRQQLLNESPYLSDTVMKSAIFKENVLPNAMIRDVLVANPQSAKSSEILDKVNDRVEPMPEEMIDEILEGKTYKGDLEILQDKLAGHQTGKYASLRKLEAHYKQDTLDFQGSQDSLINLWECETHPTIRYKLALLYLMRDDSLNCFSTLNSIPELNDLSSKELVEFDNFSELVSLFWSMRNSTTGPDSLNAIQLFSLAESSSVPGALARNIIVAAGLAEYQEPIYLADELKSSQVFPDKQQKNFDSNQRLKVFPNPAKEYFILCYDLTGLLGSFYIEIISPEGKVLIRQNLSGTENQVFISTESLPSSPYTLRLINDTSSIEAVKLIILR